MTDLDSYERPDAAVLTKLERLVEHLSEEVSQWRHRALKAESDLKATRGKGKRKGSSGPEVLEARQRVVDLEVENQALRQRIEAAKTRVQTMSGRLAFLERASEDGAA
jgi:predicted  nucleic acid-binding Zn-ribbon protein